MKILEVSGDTVDEAIEKGLCELKLEIDRVEIEIVNIQANGFLGLVGKKQAKVKLTVIENPKEDIEKFLGKVFEKMGIQVQIEIKEEVKGIYVELKGPNIGVLIGKRGQTLDSLQYLTSITYNKNKDSFKRVFLNAEKYREKREESLTRLATKMARKAKKEKRAVVLEPMNRHERRIIHESLQGDYYIKTYSEGEEPYRKVVISINN
ncbi:MAG: protein jag [Clostridiales bacterium]|nr:protein jag [Clostridiales bacterium]